MRHSTPTTSEKPIHCCGCTTQCGLIAEIHDGKVIDVRGDREHVLSGGYICPKGKDAPQFAARPDRLLVPLKRDGARGAGRWREVTWEDALDDIAARIEDITGRHGQRALAYSYGTFRGGDWGIGERFLNRFGSPNACGQDKICYGSLTLAEALTYGTGPTVFTAPLAGITRCIVVWGMRPSASAPLLWRAIGAARRAGAQLIVIDPKRTSETVHADLWLQPQPGRDAELALALLKLVVENDDVDHAFIAAHTIGFAALRAHLAEFDLETLARQCGVASAQLRDAAARFAAAQPAIINAGNGLCQSGTPAVQIGRAIACLIAVTGNLGIAGGHALGGPPRDLRANGEMFDASLLPESARCERLGAATLPYLGAGYRALDDAMAAAWHGRRDILSWIATAHEPSLWRAISSGDPYPVKALIVQHHNPLGANPNVAAVARALRSDALELSVVHDLFMTPTAQLADYVLPAAHWLEKPYFSFGIAFVGAFGDYVGANEAAVDPPGQARSDYDLFRDLGRRLGQSDAWPERAQAFYDGCVQEANLSFAAIAGSGGPLFGAAARHPAHADELPPRRFGTPSGKVELVSSLLATWGQPALPTAPRPSLAATPAWPLTLTTGGRRIEAFHQNAQHMPRYRKRFPHPEALLNARTAGRWGITQGDWMEISTPLGRVRQRAHLDNSLADDVVEADRWWYPEGTGDDSDAYGVWATNINICTSDSPEDCDPVMGTWLLRGLPCALRKLKSQRDVPSLATHSTLEVNTAPASARADFSPTTAVDAKSASSSGSD